jgi:hypothetical protein
MTLSRIPQEQQNKAEKHQEKKQTIILNRNVSQIRLNQAQSQPDLSSLTNLRIEPPLKHSSSNEGNDVDENELYEEAELQRLLKKLLLNRSIDIQNQLQIYQELTKLEE